MNAESDVQTQMEVYRQGRPKYQLIWTNHTKRFLIDDKEVDEVTWTKAIEEDKS